MLEELNVRYLFEQEGAREVWLIRHADAYADLDSPEEPWLDPPLSGRGREQADRLAARMAAVPLQAIWSSDLRRARQTAAAIAAGRGLELTVDPRLREVRTHWQEGR